MPVVTVDSNPKFQAAFTALESILTRFAELPTEDLSAVLVSSFGENFDVNALLALAGQLQTGQLDSFPTIESVPASELNEAAVAYNAELNTAYISEDYLAASSIAELTDTLLEQLGYSIDEVINAVDAPGLEGRIWAKLVQGISLGKNALTQLKTIDNLQTLTINDQAIEVEVSEPASVPVSDGDPSGEGDVTNPFQGGKGGDRFKGTDANDDMTGGNGKDRLSGGDGDDKMDGGSGKDVLKGGNGDDELLGGGSGDKMNGGNGDDLLNGGKGKDKIKGGKGADQFVYEKMSDRGDLILDFDPTADVLDLSELFSDLGVTQSTFSQLLGDVITLGSARRGTMISIDADGLDGNGKASKLAFLKKVDASDLSRSNFEV